MREREKRKIAFHPAIHFTFVPTSVGISFTRVMQSKYGSLEMST